MMARIFAYWKEHGRPAKELAFGITMAFADGTEETDDSVLKELPNFIAEDSGGLTQLDGERRIPRKPLT
jgi:hypothetical protein